MKYLVDANVLSDPTKPRPVGQVVDWLRRYEGELVVNPIILGDLEFGILLLPASKRRTRLLDWCTNGVKHLRVLELDANTASVWAKLLSTLRRKGCAMPIKDSLIAATARQHGLTIATRNLADYRYAGVKVVDPFVDRDEQGKRR